MTKKRKNSITNILIVLLALLVVASSALLFMQITPFSEVPVQKVISLTKGTSQKAKNKLVVAAIGLPDLAFSTMADEEPTEFKVEDDDQVWTTHTDIEIFSVRYDDNGDLVFTVNSSNGDKVIAPGTGDRYTFRVINEENQSLEYKLYVEAYVTGTDLWLPVEAKLHDEAGNYFKGSVDTWADVLELDGVTLEESLNAGGHTDYVIDWQWPFERTDGEGLDKNDEYDTMLGNLAMDEDLTLHIIIKTEAWASDIPVTGDNSSRYIYAVTLVVSLALLILLLVKRRRDKDEETQ